MNRAAIARVVRTLSIALFWLAVWQLLYQSVGQEILLVSPAQTLLRIIALAQQADFWISASVSLYNVALGFLCASFLGVVLGAFCSRFRLLYELIYPLLSAVKATPVASFIILALVWIQAAQVPAFIAGLIVLPIVFSNVCQGVASTDCELLEMAQVFRLNRWKTLRYVYIPTVMPYLAAAFTTGIGLAWKAGVAAEVLANTRDSIGGRIYGAKIYLDTADLFAWTVVVIVMSVVLERLLVACLRRIPWGEGKR